MMRDHPTTASEYIMSEAVMDDRTLEQVVLNLTLSTSGLHQHKQRSL